MSRGPGVVQRAILDCIAAAGDEEILMSELARTVFGTGDPTESQRASVRRAVRQLSRAGLIVTGTADGWVNDFNNQARYYHRVSPRGRLQRIPVTEKYIARKPTPEEEKRRKAAEKATVERLAAIERRIA